MTRFIVKNKQQEGMCYDEMGYKGNILSSFVRIVGRAIRDQLKRKKIFHFDLL